ncbi:MAG TPA: DUF885 family protein [Gemmatimonadaceae bacterium]|nr:DUF885 family protein [Gemmatimonadaceae bacterium]
MLLLVPLLLQVAQPLRPLFDEEWDYEMRASPEAATALGDNRFNDRLDDRSLSAIQADAAARRSFLARFEAIDTAGLSASDALSRRLMIRDLRERLDAMAFKSWEMPVNQRDGVHLGLVDLVSLTPFNTVADYDHYLARLHAMPRAFEQVTENMRQGMRDGLVPPRYLLDKVVVETQDVASKAGTASPFAVPLSHFPTAIGEADRARLRTAILAAVDQEIVPAYRTFAEFVRTEYAPHGRADPGIWALPDGEARYRFEARHMTTTDLSPDSIYAIGVAQVAEIAGQMLVIAKAQGYADLPSFNAHIKSDRTFYATSGQQVLDLYTRYARQMEQRLPELFGRLPRSKLAVIPMDAFRAPNAVPADYTSGTSDGSRPGRINVNEWGPEQRLLLNVEAIAYHEGVPGHHMQLSLAQELPDLPTFRQHGGYTAFVEGWAFYSERLGKEIGFYQDPYSDYGRLENEMWRAIRLVVDPGVHYKHWTRQQMVDVFHTYTAMDEPNVQSEVDRYISWPGQALAYKLGQLEFLKLRTEARARLGDRFDLRAFHDAALRQGALPLDVLDSEMHRWMEQALAR